MPEYPIIDELIPRKLRKIGYLLFLLVGVLYGATAVAIAALVTEGVLDEVPTGIVVFAAVWAFLNSAPNVVAVFYLNKAPANNAQPNVHQVETRGK